MALLKQRVYQHLQSAKGWLTKAEESFEKQHDIRGELDLMLAQAELQHVSEVNRSRQWRYKYAAFRHGMALTLAMCMAVVVGGAYWWAHQPVIVPPVPSLAPPSVSLPAEVVAKAEVVVAPPVVVVPVENKLPVKQTVKETVTSSPPIVAEQVRQVEPVVVVSSDEMQKLVRAAGKSLRGQ